MEASLKKGQSNWLTTNPDPATYFNTKLRRYFKIVKFMMEDAIRETAHNSFNKLMTFVGSFIPDRVEVVSVYEVRNYFSDGTMVFPGLKHNSVHPPLFETDLMRAFDDSGFSYATGVNNFNVAIMNIFNKMVE